MKKPLEVIDFGSLGGPVYAGRPKGERARKILKLDIADTEPSVVNVIIPEDTYSLNSSFFLGLFGPSVVALGSSDAFFAKYNFRAPEVTMEEVRSGVERALTEVRPL